METDAGDSEGGNADNSLRVKRERGQDYDKENVSPVVQALHPHLSGDGILKQRSSAQM